MELTSSKLKSTNGENLSLRKVYLRSFITIVSFIAVGMPILFDLHSKLTDTKLIENARR